MGKTREKIGCHIKELRTNKLKVSQNEFARNLGVDRTYLSRVESGKQNITIDTLELICNELNVSLSDFFKDF